MEYHRRRARKMMKRLLPGRITKKKPSNSIDLTTVVDDGIKANVSSKRIPRIKMVSSKNCHNQAADEPEQEREDASVPQTPEIILETIPETIADQLAPVMPADGSGLPWKTSFIIDQDANHVPPDILQCSLQMSILGPCDLGQPMELNFSDGWNATSMWLDTPPEDAELAAAANGSPETKPRKIGLPRTGRLRITQSVGCVERSRELQQFSVIINVDVDTGEEVYFSCSPGWTIWGPVYNG